MYKHLSLAEREMLFCLKEQGYSLREIAKRLGRLDTTLGRELKRNRVGTLKSVSGNPPLALTLTSASLNAANIAISKSPL